MRALKTWSINVINIFVNGGGIVEMATIYDLAKLSGVSKSSVSKVINNAPNISAKTRGKVVDAINLLGYQPNSNARNLAGGKSKVIALIIAQEVSYIFSTSFFSEAIRGISSVLSKKGYNMVLSIRNNTSIDSENSVKDMLTIPYADGYILLDIRKNDKIISLIQKIRPQRNFIVVGNWPDDPNVSFVDLDQVKASKKVFEYFYVQGHRRMAMIAGPENSQSTIDRVKGFLNGYKKNPGGEKPLILHGNYTTNAGYKNTEEILRLQPDTTAIFASSDIHAIGCLGCLANRKILVPVDISVIGFDDSEPAAHLSPALTTIHLGEYDLGCRAAELLINMIKGRLEKAEHCFFEPKLVERASVCPPKNLQRSR
jgi:DNA-binding LacI/PurR family transcriptional regulator